MSDETKLPVEEPTEAPAADSVEMKYCTKCGTKVPLDYRFCPKCSTEFPSGKSKRGNSKKLAIIISCISVLIIGLVVAGIFLFVPMYKYHMANESLKNKEYQTAIAQFKELGTYSDSQEKIGEVYTCIAYDMLDSKSYDEVCEKFNTDISYANYSYVVDTAVYNKATDALNNADYNGARHFYSMIPEHLNSSEMIKESYYLQGIANMDSAIYEDAANAFSNIKGYKDADVKTQEAYYSYGEQLYSSGEKFKAAEVFSKAGKEYKDVNQKIFDIGIDLLSDKEYNNAKIAFSLSTLGTDYQYYALGMRDMEKEEYSSAVSNFKKATTVLDGADKLAEAEKLKDEQIKLNKFKEAEKYYQEGALHQARKAYQWLPEDYSHNGTTVKDRLATLEKYSKFVDICGKWTSSVTNYVETRNVYKSSGSWDAWYVDYDANPTDKIYLEIKCIIRVDGSVNIKGSGKYLCYTNYSSLKSLLKNEYKPFSFSAIESSFPSTFEVDNNTTVSYTNNGFVLNHSEKDNYSTSFYNLYISKFTYNKKN